MQRIFITIALAFIFLGCEGQQFRSREAGALGGAALGAGLGAIIGNQTGSTGAGIAIGSAFGALSGALVGNELDNQEDHINERDRLIGDQERALEENRRLIDELKRRGTDARLTPRGVVVNLPDVLFEFNSSSLTSEASRTARQIAEVIQGGSERHISIEGHTDSIGTVSYNQRLSESRARSVADELSHNGVPRSRMTARGLGESQPIADNDSAAGRQRNRRVEVIIEN